MDPLITGVIVFALFTSFVSFFMLRAIQQARAEGLKGQGMIMKLLPFLIADGAFVIIFVIWLLNQI